MPNTSKLIIQIAIIPNIVVVTTIIVFNHNRLMVAMLVPLLKYLPPAISCLGLPGNPCGRLEGEMEARK